MIIHRMTNFRNQEALKVCKTWVVSGVAREDCYFRNNDNFCSKQGDNNAFVLFISYKKWTFPKNCWKKWHSISISYFWDKHYWLVMHQVWVLVLRWIYPFWLSMKAPRIWNLCVTSEGYLWSAFWTFNFSYYL